MNTHTNVSINGVSTALVYGARYRVTYGADRRILEDARLDSRAANGDLVLDAGTETLPMIVRVRPRSIAAIFGSGVEHPVDAGPIVPDRLDGESGPAYLERIERELGSGYSRWIGTDTGQAALETVAAETRTARKVRKLELDDAGEIRIPNPIPAGRRRKAKPAPDAAIAAFVASSTEPAALAAAAKKLRKAARTADQHHALDVVESTLRKAPAGYRLVAGEPVVDTHNHIWRCGECQRRGRNAECVGRPGAEHPAVAAPAGARYSDRIAK